MSRTALLLTVIAVTGPAILLAQAQGGAAKPAAAAQKMTDAQKITNAMSAAPVSIAKGATIMDWPASHGGQPRQLRAGTNGWVCYPTTPSELGGAAGEDPMCLDKAWQGWAGAWMSKSSPPAGGSGIAYMLRGDKGASNTDPFATGPTASNNWVVTPAHIMVLYADAKALDAYPTDPKSGGPWPWMKPGTKDRRWILLSRSWQRTM